MPSPNSEAYRHKVHSRIQNLLSGRRARHPELSRLSTRRLILEGIVEEVRIYRLHKEEKAQKAREAAAEESNMPSAAMKGMYGKEAREERRGRLRHRSRSRSRDKHHQDKRDTDHGARSTDHLVSGESNPDQASRYMMAGGLAPGSHNTPDSPRSHQKTPMRSSSEPPARSKSPRKTRHGSDGRPLVRGSRGWRDAPVGPAPKYKFKMGLTFGFGTHVKNCVKWVEEEQALKARRAERRARGTLEERMEAKRKEKMKGKGKEENEERRGREKHRERDRSPGSHRGGRGDSRDPRGRDGRAKQSRRDHDSSQAESDGQRKSDAEAEARSRGERLHRREEHARRDERSPRGEAASYYEPSPHAHFTPERANSPSVQGFGSPRPSQSSQHSPFPTSYEEYRHSHEVGEDERAQARGGSSSRSQDRSSSHSRDSGRVRHSPGAQPGNRSRTRGPHDARSEYFDVINRDAGNAYDRCSTNDTMVTDWWSVRSATPLDDEREGGYFSDGFIEDLRRRAAGGSPGSRTPRPVEGAGEKGEARDGSRTPRQRARNANEEPRASRSTSRASSNSGEVFSNFAARVANPSWNWGNLRNEKNNGNGEGKS